MVVPGFTYFLMDYDPSYFRFFGTSTLIINRTVGTEGYLRTGLFDNMYAFFLEVLRLVFYHTLLEVL